MIFYLSVFNETLKKIVKNYQANKGKIQKKITRLVQKRFSR